MGYELQYVTTLSLRQISSMVDLIVERKRGEDKAMAILVRLAYHAEGKKFKELVDTM